jgi:hypothetical protein
MPLEFASGLTVEVVPPAIPVITVAPPSPEVLRVVPVLGLPGVPGEQGPPGPQGTSGGGYRHDQLSADEVWVVPHHLGYYPAGFTAKDSSGSIIEPGDITHDSVDVSRLFFIGRAVSGVVDVS